MTDLAQRPPTITETPVRPETRGPGRVAATRARKAALHRLHTGDPRGFLAAAPHTQTAIEDRVARLRLAAGSAAGVVLLVIAQWLQPETLSPFAPPTEPFAWLAVLCGIAGVWLVPGMWLSAVLIGTGRGPVALLATRIGAPLVWYALAGPVINKLAEGARVTVGGIVGLTAAATAAVTVGLLLGLLRRPLDPLLRVLVAMLAGALCAQIAMSVSMWMWDYGINYTHIRRLSWLIVSCSALLAAAGMHGRQELPPERSIEQMRTIVAALLVFAAAAVALLGGGALWSPAQQMASTISLEQVPARTGDVALAVSAIGPDGAALVHNADFVATDDLGRPLHIEKQLVADEGGGGATLVLVVQPVSRPMLCARAAEATRHGAPVKIVVREQVSNVLTQAVIPSGWCGL